MSIIDLDLIEDHERYRAELTSISPDGRRRWIFARKPTGRYYRWRTVVSVLLLAFLFAAPFVKVDGHQFLLLNVLTREFVFFGVPFWPNDFYLVVLLFLTVVISIVVFTATLGRLWCGWLCPQTVFMEMVFRRLEWWIEGGPKEQAQRRAGPWNADRIWRTFVKVTVFFGISFLIANTFLAYVISSDTLVRYVTDGPATHLPLFIALVTFTLIFFLVFYRFREQACVIVCPYGRYMSALVDENTVAVTYDFKRGERRAKWSREDNDAKKTAQSAGDTIWDRPDAKGDCVDCHQCVTVCPTGIDIRNGIQLECVNCTACIDACDEVMDKVGMQRGLIRYTSATAVQAGHTHWFTTRIKAYLAVWIVLVSVVVTLFALRADLDVLVVRQSGSMWQTTPDGVANFYLFQVINKTNDAHDVKVSVVEPKGASVKLLGAVSTVGANGIVKGRLLVIVPDSVRRSQHADVTLSIMSNGVEVQRPVLSFIGPPLKGQ